MLPAGWTQAPLGEIAQISSGGTPDRGEPSYWDGDIPWVTTGEIQFNTITDTAEKITQTGLQNSSAKIFPAGTLLMAMYGQGKTRGQIARLNIAAATNQACAAIQFQEGYVGNFYYQFLASQYEVIRALGNAGTQKNLSAGIIKEVKVPVPPYDEQLMISEILDAWDSAIEIAEAILKNGKELKRAVIQRLFPDSKKQELLPVGFTVRRIGDLVTINPARVKKPADGKVSFVPMEAVSEDAQIIRQFERDYDAVCKGYTSFQDKDILVAKITPCFENGKGALAVGLKNGVGFGSTEFHVLRPKEGVCCSLIAHIVATRKFRRQGATEMVGSAGQKRVSSDFIRSFRIEIPQNLREQEALSAALSNFDELARKTQEKLNILRMERKAIAQQLLTGKRRLHLPATAEAVGA